jgi:FtsZ-binding cell division protein ZapB
MTDTSFDKLEKRIGDAIALITRLREDRARLESSRAELEREMEALRASNRELQDELTTLKTATVPLEEYDARKAEIQRRVENLLERFEELDETEVE